MKLASLLLFAAVTATVSAHEVTSAFETSADDPVEAMLATIGNLPRKSVSCGSGQGRQIFRAGQVSVTANEIVKHIKAVSRTPGNPQYPHNYRYLDPGVSLSSACSKQDGKEGKLFEFPIEGNGIYKGPNVGHVPDRIIVKGKLKSDRATYCGLITHRGASGNGFNSCSG